jgi:hypothetical protein
MAQIQKKFLRRFFQKAAAFLASQAAENRWQ